MYFTPNWLQAGVARVADRPPKRKRSDGEASSTARPTGRAVSFRTCSTTSELLQTTSSKPTRLPMNCGDKSAKKRPIILSGGLLKSCRCSAGHLRLIPPAAARTSYRTLAARLRRATPAPRRLLHINSRWPPDRRSALERTVCSLRRQTAQEPHIRLPETLTP